MLYLDLRNTDHLGVKEEPYSDFVEVDKNIHPILHTQINLGNNTFHNLLNYGNEYIEQILFQEDMTRICCWLLILPTMKKLS